MNNIDLNNRIAVVTGASQGFGYAISKRFAQSGAKVINIDKDPEATAEAKSKGDFDFFLKLYLSRKLLSILWSKTHPCLLINSKKSFRLYTN